MFSQLIFYTYKCIFGARGAICLELDFTPQCMIPRTKLFGNYPLLNSIVAEVYIIQWFDSVIFTVNFLVLANVFLGRGVPSVLNSILQTSVAKILQTEVEVN
jgi:hypothetical protein